MKNLSLLIFPIQRFFAVAKNDKESNYDTSTTGGED